ncbi:multiple antibiotic resistance (MarC)-related protein [Minicystis rosea]|nr:multiple antibiotic resistance (MarC)-related protein [Minicystis rosea]
MSAGLSFFTVCFPSLFSIVDPIGVVPIYLALVGAEAHSEQRRTAIRASSMALVVLLVFAATGTAIFHFFGITIPAFKVAGGILMFSMALEMLRAKTSPVKSTPEETNEARQKDDVAIIPIGVPLVAGPGAIATVIMWSSRAHRASEKVALFISVALVTGITFLTLLFAGRVVRIFGRTGINVVSRIMGLILAATAAQFVIDGWREAMRP